MDNQEKVKGKKIKNKKHTKEKTKNELRFRKTIKKTTIAMKQCPK